jgi:hypothetical protein
MLTDSAKSIAGFVVRAELAINSIVGTALTDFATPNDYADWVRKLVIAAKHGSEAAI